MTLHLIALDFQTINCFLLNEIFSSHVLILCDNSTTAILSSVTFILYWLCTFKSKQKQDLLKSCKYETPEVGRLKRLNVLRQMKTKLEISMEKNAKVLN